MVKFCNKSKYFDHLNGCWYWHFPLLSAPGNCSVIQEIGLGVFWTIPKTGYSDKWLARVPMSIEQVDPQSTFNAGGERGSPYVAAFKWSAVKLGTHGNTLPIQEKWGIYKNFSVFLSSSQPITIPDLQTLNMISIVQLWYSRPRRKSIMISWRRNAEKDVMRAPHKSFTI